MPSTIWSGNISFGLVTVPVKLVSAVRSKDVRFNQLEEGTGARIRYRRVSEASGDEVPNERIQKGYEISPGQYVVVEQDELEQLTPKASHTIDIQDFVDLEQIDPIYFEQPYYLVPDRAAERPYRLLIEAMTDLQKVAVGKIVLRAKEHLVAILVLSAPPKEGVVAVLLPDDPDHAAVALFPAHHDQAGMVPRQQRHLGPHLESFPRRANHERCLAALGDRENYILPGHPQIAELLFGQFLGFNSRCTFEQSEFQTWTMRPLGARIATTCPW